MPVAVSCRACRARVTIPDDIFERKIRGQMGAVRCDHCGGEIEVDETLRSDKAPDSAPSDDGLRLDVPVSKHEDDTPRDETPSDPILELGSSENLEEDLKGAWDGVAAEAASTDAHDPPHKQPSVAPKLTPHVVELIRDKNSIPAVFQPVLPSMLDRAPPKPHAPDRAMVNTLGPDSASEPHAASEPGSASERWHFPTSTPAPPDNWEEPSHEHAKVTVAPRDRPLSVPPAPVRRIGRYTVFEQFASGGMASVHLGRLYGAAEFSRVVAIKRLHAHLLEDPGFAEMFLSEARLAARVRHPNVVEILDVIADEHEIALVMEYVAGESLVALVRSAAKRGETLPLDIAAGILVGVLQGLHAAHEARDKHGEPLFIVHRDVSPHNVLVGADGIARVFDFGIAKTVDTDDEPTDPGMLKGKASYMAPEQIQGAPLTRSVDIFAAGVVGWELLTGHKLFGGRDNAERLYKILDGSYPRPSAYQPAIPPALDAAIMRAIARDRGQRYATAQEFAEAVEGATPVASPRVIASWVAAMAEETLAQQAEQIRAVEGVPPESSAPIAARIAEEALASLPPPAAVPSVQPQASRQRRTGWMLALGGILVGAALVMLILKLIAAPSEPSPSEAVMAGRASTSPEPITLPSAVSTAPGVSPLSPGTEPGEIVTQSPSSARPQTRTRKSRTSRESEAFRPTEL